MDSLYVAPPRRGIPRHDYPVTRIELALMATMLGGAVVAYAVIVWALIGFLEAV
jgi:hypothetical protein